MPQVDSASFQLALLCTALASAVLAGVLLAMEFFASPRLAKRAPGIIAVILVIAAVAMGCLHSTSWLSAGCAGLAGLVLVAWPVSFSAARLQLSRLLVPKFVWALVLGASMIASRYLAAHVLHSVEVGSAPHALDLEDVPVGSKKAMTDRGRSVSLFHFKMHSTDSQIADFVRGAEHEHSQLIRLAEANPASNCHGWLFTGGRYGIRDGEVSSILDDNGYAEVPSPQEGDVAVYGEGLAIRHSGLVRMARLHGPLLIESKWGPFGVYLHAVDQHPFSGTCKFYRSAREDHLLSIHALSVNAEQMLSVR